MNSTKAKAKAKAISKKKSINQKSDQSKITVVDQTDKQREFLFTVIIPVYNCAQYLPEAIDSVVAQTIGFDKIQVILVNDGSPDNSDEVCRVYQAKYPDNIIYLKQPNSGVSAARNLGMKYMSGQYVNFLDSDDKWQNDVFEKAARMFKKHPEMDVIGVRQHFFEALDTYPSLDYKFNRDKVVDIFNEYDHIQLSVTSGFFRTSAIGDIQYDTTIKYSEDSKFILEVITKQGKLGIISSSEHMYRRRAIGGSAIQSKNADVDWYTITPEKCYQWAIDFSIKRYGFVIPYVQYYIAYDYQYRAKEHIPHTIPQDIIDNYMEKTKQLLSYVDDYIILDQHNIWSEYKLEFLKFKYGDKVWEDISYRKHGIYYKGRHLTNLRGRSVLCINTFNVNRDNIVVTGTLNCSLPPKDYQLYAVVNGADLPIKVVKTDIYERCFFNKPFLSNYGVKVEVPRKGFKALAFKLVYRKYFASNLPFSTGPQSKIAMDTGLYYTKYGSIYTCRKLKIVARKRTTKAIVRSFARCARWLLREHRGDILRLRIVTILHRRWLRLRNEQIWLISDRPNVANDNGAALFEYICKHKLSNVAPYFVVDKNSGSYNKMRKIGKVVNYSSNKYKRLFLLASRNISSQADEWVVNPFSKDSIYIKDMYRSDFVFLQHGVTKDDISSWLNVYTKDIKGFVCASRAECESIKRSIYGYDDSCVWMTGFPRYDKLLPDADKRIILIAPTWRANLASSIDDDGLRAYSSALRTSEYFRFYRDLTSDGRIVSCARLNGYKIEFILHSALSANLSDFEFVQNDTVSVTTNPNYNKLICESSLMVSDYSSVVFDAASMKKPVIYAQFDKDEFFATHLYKPGYFSYEKDGFGPVCYDYESTVKAICDVVENGCKMSKKYQERVDRTFAYQDHNNCKRVLDKILAMK